MIDLKGKVAVVFGLANKRSIAYSVAQKLAEAGATLVLSYQSERLQREAEELLEDLGQTGTGRAFRCDVSRDEEIDAVFAQIAAVFPKIDILIHSVAFAPSDALKNDFLLTSREDFRIAHDISVYSLIALARAAPPLMTDGGAILTLTYYGGEKVFPNYNVMGVAKAALESTVRYLAASLGSKNIRVNAVSAGPIRTLAARGIGDFNQILDAVVARAPLRRNSPLASGITGEITFVDCGFNITGI
jgi:enoyl-[acyl-carrier protein] reductase I